MRQQWKAENICNYCPSLNKVAYLWGGNHRDAKPGPEYHWGQEPWATIIKLRDPGVWIETMLKPLAKLVSAELKIIHIGSLRLNLQTT